MNNVVVARNVTKTYRVGVGRARVREMLPWPLDAAARRLFPRWWARDTFNALDDISLSIPAGSAVGIVGHNGAGKTTLLKVIARVTAPSRGAISVTGRVAALLDVIVGFHPDLTGRENAYLLGAMHGFSRRHMAERLDAILDFAEIREFADTPIKRFSAGMVARLGFAVFTSLDVNVLLIDEVLAVGDAAFQRKCVSWLDEYRERGGTLLFVSHNLGLIRHMTERVVWLDHGKVRGDGPTAGVLAEYGRAMERRDAHVGKRPRRARKLLAREGADRWGAGGARVEEVHVEGPSGDRLDVAITYEAAGVGDAVFFMGFVDENGSEVGAAVSPVLSVAEDHGTVVCSIPGLPLRPGIYFPVVAILSPDGLVRDHWRLDRAIVVDGTTGAAPGEDFGRVAIPGAWSAGGRGEEVASP